MTALTPDCDPDLSNCGSPVHREPGVRSTVVLLALLVGSVLAVTGGAVPGLVAFLAGGTALISALVLGRRCLRLARRAVPVLAAHAPGALLGHRSRPAG
jgi:hypothetical protein